MAGREDYRVWNPQMISYAGYMQEDGSVIGDPARVLLTRVIITYNSRPHLHVVANEAKRKNQK